MAPRPTPQSDCGHSQQDTNDPSSLQEGGEKHPIWLPDLHPSLTVDTPSRILTTHHHYTGGRRETSNMAPRPTPQSDCGHSQQDSNGPSSLQEGGEKHPIWLPDLHPSLTADTPSRILRTHHHYRREERNIQYGSPTYTPV